MSCRQKTLEPYYYPRNQPLGYGIAKLTAHGTVIEKSKQKSKPIQSNVVEGYCDSSCPQVRKHDPTEWMGVL